MEAIIFWLFALVAIIGAVLLIFHKNPIHSALSLILTLFCTAALFVQLRAGFIGVLQVLVYAGAIMVLFVFVIMLLNLQREEFGSRRHRVQKAAALVIAAAIGIKMIVALSARGFLGMGDNSIASLEKLPDSFGSVESVGALIFTEYLLPFEAASVLLLAAIVGAVMVAKTRV